MLQEILTENVNKLLFNKIWLKSAYVTVQLTNIVNNFKTI